MLKLQDIECIWNRIERGENVPNCKIDSEWKKLQEIPKKERSKKEFCNLQNLARMKATLIWNDPPKKADEKIAKMWLEMEGYRNIQQPPNDPPDLVVDDRYAVEVRRLNRMHEVTNKGEEEYLFPVRDAVRKVLDEFNCPSHSGQSWYLYLHYHIGYDKSLPNEENLKNKLREFLNSFNNSSIIGIPLIDGIDISIQRGPESHPSRFMITDPVDPTTGWILAELWNTIPCYIREKTEKVKNSGKVQHFECWWLVLVDHISQGSLNEHQFRSILETLPLQDLWSRITVLNFLDPTISTCYFPKEN